MPGATDRIGPTVLAVDLALPRGTAVPQARWLLRTLLFRRWWLDAIAAIFLVVLSTTVAYRYVDRNFALSYDSAYRDCTEDLLYPCVGRLGFTIDAAALEASPHWQAFVAGKIDTLACDALRDLPRTSAGHLSDVQRYLHASLSAFFRWSGPRRSVYVSYMSAMVGLTVLASYGLFRLAVGPLFAVLAALPFLFSDLHLRSALHPAEYVKAPFFLACFFLVGAIVAGRGRRRQALVLAAAAGAIVGIGIGYKTEVLICLPITVIVVAAFAPRSIGAWPRAAATLAFVGAVLAAGWPVLQAQFLGEWGSLLPVQVLGGMNRNFADYYAQPSLYDYGIRFDDTHITYLINSYDQRTSGSVTFVGFYSTQLQRAATRLVADIDRMFPGDFLLRSFAAIVNVLKLGRFGIPAAFVVLSVLLVTDPRLGGTVAFLLCTAVGYVSLAFQTKHFFHLEWVPWWFTALAAEQALVLGIRRGTIDMTRARRSLVDGVRALASRIAVVSAVALGAFAVFLMARQQQQARVTAVIAALMQDANDERLSTLSTLAEDGTTRLSVAGLGSAVRPTPLAEDYLVLDVECGTSADAVITGVYEQATSPRERMIVPCSRGARRWKLFWPVYQYPPDARFQWFEASPAPAIRIASIHRVNAGRQGRLLLKLAVPENYQRRQWYHVLRRRFVVEPLGVVPTT